MGKIVSILSLGLVLTCLFALIPCSVFSQQAHAILKNGSCPSGYRTSGKYCVPGKNASFAIEKIGSCPSGYRTSGKYCIAGENARFIIIKIGNNCPSGFHTTGKYCAKNR